MKWWIVLFAVSFAAALPHDRERPQQVRRVVAHKINTDAAPAHSQAGARIPPPVKPSVKRVHAVRVVPAKSTVPAKPIRTVSVPYKSQPPQPTNIKRVTSISRNPAMKTFPGVRTLTKAESEALQRQIQQWQIAVVGGQVPTGYPGAPQPPSGAHPAGPVYPAGPGTIWIQVPAGGYPYPPSYPTAVQPTTAPPIAPDEATQEGQQPVPEVTPATEEESEGADPVEEGPAAPLPGAGVGGEEVGAGEGDPAAPEAPTEEAPAPEEGGVSPEAETPGEEEGETPAEETPGASQDGTEGGAPVEEKPEGEAPSEGPQVPEGEAAPAEGETSTAGEDTAAPPPTEGVAGGDEQENKLVYCKEERGVFSHESSCSLYYNCWDGEVAIQSCPKDLAFSEENAYCDYPKNVDCGARTMGDFSPEIEDAEGCPSPYGSYGSKSNCSEFFRCDHGKLFKFACSGGLHYDQRLGVCDYPHRANCTNQTTPLAAAPDAASGGSEDENTPSPAESPAPAEPAPAPTAEQAATPDALRGLPPAYLKAGSPCWHNNVYPLNKACSRVSVCRSGTTSILACPEGMAYDIYKHRCLPYYRARC